MEWQNFLNLCICQESQLQRVEDYRRVSRGGVGGGRDAYHLLKMTELHLCAWVPVENNVTHEFSTGWHHSWGCEYWILKVKKEAFFS